MIDLGLTLLIWMAVIILLPLSILTLMVTLAALFGKKDAD
jgi:hypothetical protein